MRRAQGGGAVDSCAPTGHVKIAQGKALDSCAPKGLHSSAQGNALGLVKAPDPRVLKERRMTTRGRARASSTAMRRSFRAHRFAAHSTQGVALGWYAKPRWGSPSGPHRATP